MPFGRLKPRYKPQYPRSPVRKPRPAPAGRVLFTHERRPGHGNVEDAPILKERPGVFCARERQRPSCLAVSVSRGEVR